MRAVAMLLVLGTLGSALAQEVPTPLPPPPTPTVAQPLAMPAPPTPPSLQLTVPEPMLHEWHGARVMSGFGDAFGIIGTGLSLGVLIYIAATSYPPSVGDFTAPPKLSDPVQVISLVASTMSAVGFGLAAGSLSWRHHILEELDADTGRGLFVAGTVIGLVGLVGVGASYFFGFTDYLNPHDRTVAVIVTSLGGAAICTIGTILYSRDAAKLNRAWERLTTF
jgi:hypothetical protein